MYHMFLNPTSIFVLECLFKIIDMGFMTYLKDGWNRLDFVVVFLSLLDIFIEYALGGSSNKLIRLGPQIIRIFRIVRVVRVLQLIKRLKSLKKILESLIISLPDILNVAILLFLFYFIYAVLAVFLFKDIKTGATIDKYNNFSNFFSACMTLLGLISGQTWTVVMLDCFKLPPNCSPGQTCGTSNFFVVFVLRLKLVAAPFFFISFILIGIFIVQNLFVLVLLGSLNHENTEKPKHLFEKAYKEIKNHYLETLKRERINSLRTKDVINFFLTLKPPYGKFFFCFPRPPSQKLNLNLKISCF